MKYILLVSTLMIIFFSLISGTAYSQVEDSNSSVTVFQHPFPKISDPNLKVELVADGLFAPTGTLFLDKDNILVLQRYSSGFPLGGITTVNLISNGRVRQEPVLTVLSGLCDIHNPPPGCYKFNERGLLGIASRKINNTNMTLAGNLQVYLYYTEITLTGEPLGNRVYKYLWDGRHLINPSLILDLPATPGPNHNAGKLLIGPDGFLYTVIGDQEHRGQLQNINGPPPDNTSVIFRVNPETGAPGYGNPFITVSKEANVNLTLSKSALNRYYAYGIRNSFGLAFDPVSGNLWDTENGVKYYDEINLVKPGFNSGWKTVVGPIERANKTEADLVHFPKSYYSDPEFSWKYSVAVTALGFLNSSKLGEKYKNNLFVGDYNTGSLYFFKINKARDGIEFDSNQKELADHVADNPKEGYKTVLGTGFDIITDIKTGPDGYLYIASYSKEDPDQSRIYRIVAAT
jgi:aldose sugar dehydrogenase